MSINRIITIAKIKFGQITSEEDSRKIQEAYRLELGLKEENERSDNFYTWYYINHANPYTIWVSTQELPKENTGTFYTLDVNPFAYATNAKGCEWCEKEKAEFWKVEALLESGEAVSLADCDTERHANAFAEELMAQLKIIKSLPQQPVGFTCNPLELMKAMALSLYVLDTTLAVIRNDFYTTGTDQQRRHEIADYGYSFPLKNKNELPDHFYFWYFLNYQTSFTSLSVKDIPSPDDGPFRNFKIHYMAETYKNSGHLKRCYKEDKAYCLHVFAQGKGIEPLLIAECSVGGIAEELVEELAVELNHAQPDPKKWPNTFTFSAIELTKAMALVLHRFHAEKTIP